MTTHDTGWMRDKERLGVWEHRGKVAVAGVGHSPIDRRWDGVSMDKTLGAYSILACQRAMEDAGVTPDQVDGVICCPETVAGPMGGASSHWAPRPYFAPPYDSEAGLTLVTAEWLVKQMGLKNVKYAPSNAPHVGELIGLAAQAVGDGRCNTCLVIYPSGNLEGRYRRGGANLDDYAKGNRQWTVPWGQSGGWDFDGTLTHEEYCRKYGKHHDMLAPFAVNQRRNGLRTPWGFYTTHEPYQITTEDYLNSRYFLKPLRIFDCDRPVNASAAWLFTTAERARDMKQKPVYILNHTECYKSKRSTQLVLDEVQECADRLAGLMWEGSGLDPKDVDVFNPYDGYLTFTQFFLEGFQWHGVKKGEALDFYAGDIRVEGPHPFNSSGGNNGNGRTRTAMFTDCIEQLRGTAGERQIRIRCETALAGGLPPTGSGWVMFSKHPS